VAQGIHYLDKTEPLMSAAQATVTLATTDKLMIPAAFTTCLVFGLRGQGRQDDLPHVLRGDHDRPTRPTSGSSCIGVAADAGGTLLASSAALALVASQTSVPFRIEAYLTNRGPYGAACSVIPWGICKFGTAVIASPNDHFIVPAGAPTAVNVDVTAASGFNVQIKRTGSTAETVTVQDVVPTIS
jgi:hypothetical protein